MKKLLRFVILFPVRLMLSVFVMPTIAIWLCLELAINGGDRLSLSAILDESLDLVSSLWSE